MGTLWGRRWKGVVNCWRGAQAVLGMSAFCGRRLGSGLGAGGSLAMTLRCLCLAGSVRVTGVGSFGLGLGLDGNDGAS